jgi:hypothetical protein
MGVLVTVIPESTGEAGRHRLGLRASGLIRSIFFLQLEYILRRRDGLAVFGPRQWRCQYSTSVYLVFIAALATSSALQGRRPTRTAQKYIYPYS